MVWLMEIRKRKSYMPLRRAEYLYFKEILFGLYKSHSINKKTAYVYLKRVRHFPRALVCIVRSEVHRKVFRLSGKPYVFK